MSQFERDIRAHLLRKNPVGKSGAAVYELDNGWVAKHVRRSELPAPSLWETYLREAQFYGCFSEEGLPFLPQVGFCSYSEDEIQIILKKYRPLPKGRLDNALLEKVLAALAQVHRLPVPEFLQQPDAGPVWLEPETIAGCLHGWQEVLAEHEGMLPSDSLHEAAESINAINQRLHSARRWLCHGDFHLENLLTDENGEILICDWQGVRLGHAAGDLSFFLSRLSADGCDIPREQAVQAYCRFAGTGLTPEEILVQMALASLSTSFLFWHQYLHGCPAGRVRDIFGKMAADLSYLLQR